LKVSKCARIALPFVCPQLPAGQLISRTAQTTRAISLPFLPVGAKLHLACLWQITRETIVPLQALLPEDAVAPVARLKAPQTITGKQLTVRVPRPCLCIGAADHIPARRSLSDNPVAIRDPPCHALFFVVVVIQLAAYDCSDNGNTDNRRQQSRDVFIRARRRISEGGDKERGTYDSGDKFT
jgi:hypothetical protein